MVMGFRPKLGQNLQGLVEGDQPWMNPRPDVFTPKQDGMDPMDPMAAKPRSKGQMIAGIISDALAGFNGQQGQFGQMIARERQQQQADQREEVQWTRRRQQQNDDWTQREDYKRANPDPTAMERNLSTYQGWGPEQRAAYGDMQQAERGDPFVTTTLPNGQFYAGPQSGLIGALTGHGAAPAAKPRRLGPVVDAMPGGAGASAPRPFVEAPRGYAPPATLKSGRMTSGRRTPEGNALVGGVAGSKHLTGEAADYWGADLGAVLREAQGLPGVNKAFIHGNGGKRHVHTEGDWNTPYFGRNGTKGR